MNRRFAALAALAALAGPLLSAPPLAAQVPRLPVVNNGVARGILVAGDVGFPNDVAGGRVTANERPPWTCFAMSAPLVGPVPSYYPTTGPSASPKDSRASLQGTLQSESAVTGRPT